MGKKPTDPPESGDPTGLWRTLDTESATASFDPYNRAGVPNAEAGDAGRRRSPAGMHKLSEAIKNTSQPERIGSAQPAAPTLFQRLATLRADLERVLAEIEILCATDSVPGDSTMADLVEQLKQAAVHLEDASDYLMPLPDQQDRPLAPDQTGSRSRRS
jgi:hypothetical protein